MAPVDYKNGGHIYGKERKQCCQFVFNFPVKDIGIWLKGILFLYFKGVKLLTYLYQLCLEHSSSNFYPILLSLLKHSLMPYIM